MGRHRVSIRELTGSDLWSYNVSINKFMEGNMGEKSIHPDIDGDAWASQSHNKLSEKKAAQDTRKFTGKMEEHVVQTLDPEIDAEAFVAQSPGNINNSED